MSTLYRDALKEDQVLAQGFGLGLHSGSYKGFSAGISAYYTLPLFTTPVFRPDPHTGQINRYESGLLDLTDSSKKYNLYRLEELYLDYAFSKSSVRVGNMKLQTPFFNPQDGRMSPTYESGVWIQMNEWEKFSVTGGWIWSVSPRSTVSWYNPAASVGIYPVGVNMNGSKSQYYHNITGSTGVALLNLAYRISPSFSLSIWESLFENVMNTVYTEIRHKHKLKLAEFYSGLIYIHQDALNNGGNPDPNKTYMEKGARSNLLSAQAGIRNNKMDLSLNYTHITGDGRYLMPREWGRDMIYTFVQRERNEGLGLVHTFVIRGGYMLAPGLKTGLALGYFSLPDVKNYRLNKYSLPSYYHICYELAYRIPKVLNRLELKALIAYKENAGNLYNNLKYVYNRVNLINLNFMLDYTF